MKSLTINTKNEELMKKVIWVLEHFKSDGLEIIEKEDLNDLKILMDTRDEDSIEFVGVSER